MQSRRGTRLALGLLAGVAGPLALVDLHLLQSPVDITPVLPPGGGGEARLPQAPEPATQLDKKSVEQFGETVGRPLFNPSRRPVQRNRTAAVPDARTAPSKLRLIGVMRMGEEPPRALMRFADEPTGKWVTEGAEFKGWRLRTIKERSVVVEAGRRSQELTLPAMAPAARADPPPKAAGPTGGTDRN